MALGDVDIRPFDGAENIAQYVAFAASVRRSSSTLGVIESIAALIGEFTACHESVRAVSVPLLGTGAGGLQPEKVVAALMKGFTRNADDAAVLTIHVLDREVYDRIRAGRHRADGLRCGPVRVFISHTSSSEDSVEWVKELALFLMGRGIQARLDRFHLRRGMDLSQWMCNELAMATKAVIVCDETYKKKADGRLGGVGWETMLIQGDMASLPPDSTKYQVVVRAEELSSALPMYLRTKYAFHARPSDESRAFRDELVRELLDLAPDERLTIEEFTL
jgi:hypothetical protein